MKTLIKCNLCKHGLRSYTHLHSEKLPVYSTGKEALNALVMLLGKQGLIADIQPDLIEPNLLHVTAEGSTFKAKVKV